MKEYNLFVAGIPNGTHPRRLERCFARAGYQVRVNRSESAVTSVAGRDQLCKGHCVITAIDAPTYVAIRDGAEVAIDDRVLICQPFLRGEELYHQIAVSNRKRVILKGVPGYVELDFIRLRLEQSYGRVENLFKFKPDGRAAQDRGELGAASKKVSLSIMFSSHLSAKKATIDGYFEVEPGYLATFDAFRSKKKTASSIDYFGSTPYYYNSRLDVEYQDVNIYQEALVHQGDHPGQNFGRSGALRELAPKAEKPALINRRKTATHVNHRDETPRRAVSHDKNYRESSGISRHYFSNLLLDRTHHLKPTSRIYKLLRREVSKYSATFELQGTWIDRTNLRYNPGSRD